MRVYFTKKVYAADPGIRNLFTGFKDKDPSSTARIPDDQPFEPR